MTLRQHSYTAKDLVEQIEERGLYELVATAAAQGKIRQLREDFLRALRGRVEEQPTATSGTE